jgi:uroporphyrinogen-III synthase
VRPVLDIRELVVDPAARAAERDIVIFLSEHAARLGAWAAEGAAGPILAVGGRTADVLARSGVTARVPQEETSEGLLALPELAAVEDRRVLLVAGRGGRDLLGKALVERGASVSRLEVYERVATGTAGLVPDEIDVIVAASGDGITQAARLWFGARGRADVWVLVPSVRVAEIANDLGLQRVRVCSGAGTAAILEGLAALQSREQHER